MIRCMWPRGGGRAPPLLGSTRARAHAYRSSMAPHDGTPPWQRRLRALPLRSPRPTGTPRPMPAASSQQQQPLPPPLRGAPRVFHDTAPGGTERAECLTFFRTYGFAVLGTALDKSEVEHLNNWYDASQRRYPEQWGTERGPSVEKMFHQPLLYYTELDQYVRHSGHYSLVAELLGGEEHARFSEFDVSAATASLGCDDSLTADRCCEQFRETPAGTGGGFHQVGRPFPLRQSPLFASSVGDIIFGLASQDGGHARASDAEAILARRGQPHMDYICSMHYLTDVSERSPAFSVIPQVRTCLSR